MDGEEWKRSYDCQTTAGWPGSLGRERRAHGARRCAHGPGAAATSRGAASPGPPRVWANRPSAMRWARWHWTRRADGRAWRSVRVTPARNRYRSHPPAADPRTVSSACHWSSVAAKRHRNETHDYNHTMHCAPHTNLIVRYDGKDEALPICFTPGRVLAGPHL